MASIDHLLEEHAKKRAAVYARLDNEMRHIANKCCVTNLHILYAFFTTTQLEEAAKKMETDT